MRLAFVCALVLAACFGSTANELATVDDPDPSQDGTRASCAVDADCQLFAASCCECPSFATTLDDPKASVCEGVECPPRDCPDNVAAVCGAAGECTLACKPLACQTTCPTGYAVADNGCLSCVCAPEPGTSGTSCAADTDCVRTRADCCGCEQGGLDTAVLASQQASFDAQLACPAMPSCPGVNQCNVDEQPRCIQGACQLTATPPPGNACRGPADCPSGTICVVNASDQANQYGVGECRAP